MVDVLTCGVDNHQECEGCDCGCHVPGNLRLWYRLTPKLHYRAQLKWDNVLVWTCKHLHKTNGQSNTCALNEVEKRMVTYNAR